MERASSLGGLIAPAFRQREPPPPALNKEPFAGPEAPAPGAAASPESARSVLPLLAIHAESGGTRQKGGDPCGAGETARAAVRLHPAGVALPPELWGLQMEPTWWRSRPYTALRLLHPPPFPSSQALRSAETAILHPEAWGCRGWRGSAAKPEKEALEGVAAGGSNRPSRVRSRPAQSKTKMAVRGVPGRPPLAIRPPASLGLGMARGPFAA